MKFSHFLSFFVLYQRKDRVDENRIIATIFFGFAETHTHALLHTFFLHTHLRIYCNICNRRTSCIYCSFLYSHSYHFPLSVSPSFSSCLSLFLCLSLSLSHTRTHTHTHTLSMFFVLFPDEVSSDLFSYTWFSFKCSSDRGCVCVCVCVRVCVQKMSSQLQDENLVSP